MFEDQSDVFKADNISNFKSSDSDNSKKDIYKICGA